MRAARALALCAAAAAAAASAATASHEQLTNLFAVAFATLIQRRSALVSATPKRKSSCLQPLAFFLLRWRSAAAAVAVAAVAAAAVAAAAVAVAAATRNELRDLRVVSKFYTGGVRHTRSRVFVALVN